MTVLIDHTHDPTAKSWLPAANDADTDFPIQNLPLGQVQDRVNVAIGDQAFDLTRALDQGLLNTLPSATQQALRAPRLNPLFALGRASLRELRHAVFDLLREGSPHADRASTCLQPQTGATIGLPCDIGDYTDFFASLNHARNTFALFRAGQEFLPNYKHLPIAYHGRSSSVFAAPRDFHRPWGQFKPDPMSPPLSAPSRKLDFEVELGLYVAAGNEHGQPVSLDEAEDHLAGVCLLNDWSARDVQAWESQPLGPFLSKNFMTAVSPWVVTLDALAPFRSPLVVRSADDPAPQPYLASTLNTAQGAFDIEIETWLQTEAMRQHQLPPIRVSVANTAQDLWWTPAQMLAHHTMGGCNLRAGDLLGSGTVSGAEPGTAGSLLELTWGGTRPLQLPNGETRAFLSDGDEVTLTGKCKRGHRHIGLGVCRSRVMAAHDTMGRLRT